MKQLTEAQLNQKIDSFLSSKISDYTPSVSRNPEKEADAKQSLFTRLSTPISALIGNQPVLHR